MISSTSTRGLRSARAGSAPVSPRHIVIKDISRIRETIFCAGPRGLKPAALWWDWVVAVVGKRTDRIRVLKFMIFFRCRLAWAIFGAVKVFTVSGGVGGLQVGCWHFGGLIETADGRE